jgi:hypothetical protein
MLFGKRRIHYRRLRLYYYEGCSGTVTVGDI